MARLILKSPYIRCGGSGEATGYMSYIATRENVQLIADDRPATRRQTQLIQKLLQDFPDTASLYAYEDWTASQTKRAASALISTVLHLHQDTLAQSDIYMKYIAQRPRAERLGTHGLFGDEDNVDLEQAMAQLESYTGRVWTHIISLHREDAERLGYDNAPAWRDFLRAQRNEIAEAMHIPPGNFRWYAAFHNEADHPHVHMMAWSCDPAQGRLDRDGIRKIRSVLTNDLFRHELLHVYAQKSQVRDELVQQARRSAAELIRTMQVGICDFPEAEALFRELAMQLETVKGKKQYGYLPKKLKALVDTIVDQMQSLPPVSECYARWQALQEQVQDFYSEKPAERLPLSRQKEFRAVKNAVIQEAERIRCGEISFEDEDEPKEATPDEHGASYPYQYLDEIIDDPSVPLDLRDEAVGQLQALAEDGDTLAQYRMGQLFRDGGIVIPDGRRASVWFRKAAEQGQPEAQYALARLLLSPDPELRDPQEGLTWLKAAVKNESPYAACRLAKEYLKGENLTKDVQAAMDCLSPAAAAGDRYAQYLLGKLCLGGDGAERDRDQAAYWLERSAAQGNPYAEFLLERIDDPNPPSVILSVTRLLHHMSRILRDNMQTACAPAGMQMDQKRRRKLQQKRIALGHKPDDHEEPQTRQELGQQMGW